MAADLQENVTVIIRTLIRECLSRRTAAVGSRFGLCAVIALLAGGASAEATAGELPSLESLLKGKPQKKATLPARVEQETLFDVIDPDWSASPVPVQPEPVETLTLEPVPAGAADLIESIHGEDGSRERLTNAIPLVPSPPVATLKPALPVPSGRPVIAQRPAPVSSEAAPSHAAREFVLGSVEVRKLITRARKELEAGDIAMAHAFTEAAAEAEIPFALFEENSLLLIDEVETVRTLRFQQAAAWQPQDLPESEPQPEPLARSIEQQPQVWRALGGPTLNTAPPAVDRDGSRQELPEARGIRMLSQVPKLHQTMGTGRGWEPISYSWEAPALKYNPLYFEDPQLERHGNEIAYVQPAISAGRFFATIPTLPYQMGTENNSVCHTVYDLGNNRPGTCEPYSIPLLPLSLTGALTQGGAATALVFILP